MAIPYTTPANRKSPPGERHEPCVFAGARLQITYGLEGNSSLLAFAKDTKNPRTKKTIISPQI